MMRGPAGTLVVVDADENVNVFDVANVSAIVVEDTDQTCSIFVGPIQLHRIDATAAQLEALAFDRNRLELATTDGRTAYVDAGSVEGLRSFGDDKTVLHLTGSPILHVQGAINTVSALVYEDHPAEGLNPERRER